jgi:hypothetical protein
MLTTTDNGQCGLIILGIYGVRITYFNLYSFYVRIEGGYELRF